MRHAAAIFLFTAFASAACGGNDNAPTNGVFDVSALQSTDPVVGSGAAAASGQRITVHYTGWLYNPNMTGGKGTRFPSSRDAGAPFAFVLGTGSVIRGWDQGVPGMRVGGTRTLVIPSALAYGSSGSGPIPPNSAIVFDIELISIP